MKRIIRTFIIGMMFVSGAFASIPKPAESTQGLYVVPYKLVKKVSDKNKRTVIKLNSRKQMESLAMGLYKTKYGYIDKDGEKFYRIDAKEVPKVFRKSDYAYKYYVNKERTMFFAVSTFKVDIDDSTDIQECRVFMAPEDFEIDAACKTIDLR